MAKAICINGHFYDDEKFRECPHCAAGMKPATPSAFAVVQAAPQEDRGREKTEEKRKLFGRRKDHKSREDKEKGKENTASGRWQRTTRSDSYQEILQNPEKNAEIEQNNQPVMGDGERITHKIDRPYMMAMGEKNNKMLSGEMEDGYAERISEKSMERGYPDSVPEKGMERSADNGERNISGNGQRTDKQNEGRTIGYFSADIDREPPVGYLICIEGEDYGTGFPLKSGSNSLGRSGSMDVVVMDPKVSREKQAYVMYEPHKREFFLKPGDSAGLCYLNDDLVLEPKKLQAYDIILLGDTKLMLIPVCGEKFSW